MGSLEETRYKEGCLKLETTDEARDFEFIGYVPRKKFWLAPSWIPVNNTQAAVDTLDKIHSVSVNWDFIYEHQH